MTRAGAQQSTRMHKIGDASYLTGLTLFGLSLTEIQFVLQLIALVLGIVATGITIGVHFRRWIRELKERR